MFFYLTKCHCITNYLKSQSIVSFPIVVIVAEVTQKSLGVGYEIGRAVSLNKLVICLFRSDSEESKILRFIFTRKRQHSRIEWCLLIYHS